MQTDEVCGLGEVVLHGHWPAHVAQVWSSRREGDAEDPFQSEEEEEGEEEEEDRRRPAPSVSPSLPCPFRVPPQARPFRVPPQARPFRVPPQARPFRVPPQARPFRVALPVFHASVAGLGVRIGPAGRGLRSPLPVTTRQAPVALPRTVSRAAPQPASTRSPRGNGFRPREGRLTGRRRLPTPPPPEPSPGARESLL
ncbi:transmembrane protease serine 13-like [Dipodomys merriami]|uniref:transmembrane protease serine 13-like n=1 Tax=Dipodomys merriami TaxID=94247 RepID=UPI003855B15A